MTSGENDNPATDDEITSFRAATIDGGGSHNNAAGVNSFRLYIIEDGGSFTTNSDVADSGKYTLDNGYMAYGLLINAAFGPVKVKLQGAYVQAHKPAKDQKKDMGYEADANIGYALTKSSTFYVEGAYLKTGKFYEGVDGENETQNAQYINFGITYSI